MHKTPLHLVLVLVLFIKNNKNLGFSLLFIFINPLFQMPYSYTTIKLQCFFHSTLARNSCFFMMTRWGGGLVWRKEEMIHMAASSISTLHMADLWQRAIVLGQKFEAEIVILFWFD